ncbi:hypothetical protein CFHF_06355 [Caulobacter flavus]|uniref:Lipoprotein n=1 Tax=Caulobacter flavus TaxID=1679497 RepID=A0A2N5CX83_9CAUL|nr:hypothetical protein [Caulobacter flavus]AYV47524.1 hypothetical protein C1707_15355 [Caulobacter flavus]PLR18366.1 hypothetical protein CFHF_06355 [Caulobacter flavus]
MRLRWILLVAVLAVSACSREQERPATPQSDARNAAASAPAGVGSTREGRPSAGAPGADNTPTATDASENAHQTGGQTATSRSSSDQQGLTGSPPDTPSDR